MFIATHQLRVRYAETDQMNIVYHGNYATYFEVARVESIRELGFTYKQMEETGVIMPLVELHIKYIRPAYYDDLLTIKTMVKELPTDHRIEFFHEVYNDAQKLLTTARVVLYFMDAATNTKATMPPALRERIEPYFTQQSETL